MTQHGAAGSARATARRAAGSNKLEMLARVGYAVSGVLHLLIGWIALQVAWAGSAKKADQSGALSALAGNSVGKVLLWLGVLGFVGLALWQLTETLLGAGGSDEKERAAARAKAGAKTVVYAALALTTLKFATGSGSSSGKQSKDFTASLLQHTGGRVLVVLMGLGVVAVGCYHVYKGAAHKFLDDLVGHPGTMVVRLATAGYVAKGVALAVVGLLFVVAGVRSSAKGATGLDGALKTLREQPFGAVLLTVVALGIIAYGVYSFVRARSARL